MSKSAKSVKKSLVIASTLAAFCWLFLLEERMRHGELKTHSALFYEALIVTATLCIFAAIQFRRWKDEEQKPHERDF
jgi:hypothetical protein